MQRLLRGADWDIDGVREDLRDYVIEHLGDREGVLRAGAGPTMLMGSSDTANRRASRIK